MVHSCQLIILATTKVGERSLVLHCLSSIWGRRSFITSVSRSAGMSMFLPLNIIDAEVTENAKSDLWRIGNISARFPLNGIRGNMYKNSMTMFMSEVLYRCVKDGAREDGLFEWCLRSILTLDALESDFSNYHLRWLLELASALGFSPSTDDLVPFCNDHLQEVSRLLTLDLGSSLLLPLSGESRNAIADILLRYISYHTESRLEIRSLRVLHELFR